MSPLGLYMLRSRGAARIWWFPEPPKRKNQHKTTSGLESYEKLMVKHNPTKMRLRRDNLFQTFARIIKIPERHVLARNRSPCCPQIGGTQNVRLGAPVKLGFENFTFLGVYILRTLRVSVFADWWRPYNAIQGIRFEVSALAILSEIWSKLCFIAGQLSTKIYKKG